MKYIFFCITTDKGSVNNDNKGLYLFTLIIAPSLLIPYRMFPLKGSSVDHGPSVPSHFYMYLMILYPASSEHGHIHWTAC